MEFDEWLRSFPWLFESNRKCIVSADLDGVACGLLQGLTLSWQTVGTYDGKLLALYESVDRIDWRTVVFVDVEIFRRSIRSIGNHLFAIDRDDVDRLRNEFPHCASPNLWRGINVRECFQRKYPFSTLPILLASHAVSDDSFELDRFWLSLVLHTDSSFTNAAMYQANALDWLSAMNTHGRSAGLDRMCRYLNRIPGQSMIGLLNHVQSWISEAGFGGLQRACRFDPRDNASNERVALLVERLMEELGSRVSLPFGRVPEYVEEFETAVLPNHTVGRRKVAFDSAWSRRVLSMAATGRSDKGLSVTYPNPDSPVAVLR